MAKFTPVPGLDSVVARLVAPEVRKVAKKVERVAKRTAPPGKRWVSVGDNNVRDTHREAHQHPMIPGNLRFAVRGQPWDITHGLSQGVDYLLEPKDTSTGLPLDSVQHVHCRCHVGLHPTFLSEKITVGPTKVYGPHVEVVVSCTAHQVVQAEFGDTYPTGDTAPGTRFMGRAAALVAGQPGPVRGFDTPGGNPTVGGEDN